MSTWILGAKNRKKSTVPVLKDVYINREDRHKNGALWACLVRVEKHGEADCFCLSSSVAKFFVKENCFGTGQRLSEHLICCEDGVAITTFLKMKIWTQKYKTPSYNRN